MDHILKPNAADMTALILIVTCNMYFNQKNNDIIDNNNTNDNDNIDDDDHHDDDISKKKICTNFPLIASSMRLYCVI